MKQAIYIVVILILAIGLIGLYAYDTSRFQESKSLMNQKDVEIEGLNNQITSLKSIQEKISEEAEITNLVVPDFIKRMNLSKWCSSENTNIKNLQVNNSKATLNVNCYCGNVCSYFGHYTLKKQNDSWIIESLDSLGSA